MNMYKAILGAVALLTLPFAASATEYRIVERPRQECWQEQVPVQAAGNDYGGAIVGGIAGGILGNQVGGGSGKTIATAVGAMTGAVVGDRMSSRSVQYQNVERCQTVVEQVRVPAYEQPPQVYRQPVQVQSAPVYIMPEPMVVDSPVYYVDEGPYRRHGGRGHWKHHRHHDDDD
ncbi:glycine zipper 2TM domain-containing protein [Noviherbaspirillum sp. Root189]|uniref:glycine zipper 2TM domain-containing protein n=1 Tax=Noviherbaspirillum sp. Root189 TaxID=1736487 RepID=UPI0009E8DAC6|nr:glycine zipper 2TM domain-containing protein [Noviherbaspirillum sp. Root189]